MQSANDEKSASAATVQQQVRRLFLSTNLLSFPSSSIRRSNPFDACISVSLRVTAQSVRPLVMVSSNHWGLYYS
jgi:hypothetical protein